MYGSTVKDAAKFILKRKGELAAKEHYAKYGAHFLNNPKSQFGEAFNDTMFIKVSATLISSDKMANI